MPETSRKIFVNLAVRDLKQFDGGPSEPQQDAQPVLDLGHRTRVDCAPAHDQSLDRHGPDGVAEDRRPALDARLRWRDRDVARHVADRRGHRQDDDEAARDPG